MIGKINHGVGAYEIRVESTLEPGERFHHTIYLEIKSNIRSRGVEQADCYHRAPSNSDRLGKLNVDVAVFDPEASYFRGDGGLVIEVRVNTADTIEVRILLHCRNRSFNRCVPEAGAHVLNWRKRSDLRGEICTGCRHIDSNVGPNRGLDQSILVVGQ